MPAFPGPIMDFGNNEFAKKCYISAHPFITDASGGNGHKRGSDQISGSGSSPLAPAQKQKLAQTETVH